MISTAAAYNKRHDQGAIIRERVTASSTAKVPLRLRDISLDRKIYSLRLTAGPGVSQVEFLIGQSISVTRSDIGHGPTQ